MDADGGVPVLKLGFGRVQRRLRIAYFAHGPQAGDALAIGIGVTDAALERGGGSARFDPAQGQCAAGAEFFVFGAEFAVVLTRIEIGVQAGDELAGRPIAAN